MKSIKNLPSQGECKINRNHIKKPLVKKNVIQELKNREGGFVLNGDVLNSKLSYDPINDEHLKQFFVNKKIKPYLNKLNKIINKSNHTSDDDLSKDDSTRIITQNNSKNSQFPTSGLKQKGDNELRDIKNVKIEEEEDLQQKEILKEKERNFQQIELPKISINNSTNLNSNYSIYNNTAGHLNSAKENSGLNPNNTSLNFVNTSINNSTIYSNNHNNSYTSSALDQIGRISHQEALKKNEIKLQALTKLSNQYQNIGLRNKIILRPLHNQDKDKLDKDSLDIKKAYGSVKQDESNINYKLQQKRNSQNSVSYSAINSDQENYNSSDYKINPIKNFDNKKKIRSITGNKKIGMNESILSTIDNPQYSQNQSMYDGYLNQLKKGGILSSTTSNKPVVCDPNQIYFKNLKSEIENIEKQNESKGIIPVSKDQFSSFIKQFKTKYKSNPSLNQNSEVQEDQQSQQNYSESKKNDIQQLKREKQEIIKRQEQELYELEQKIIQFEQQEKELHKDICLLDQQKQKLYVNQDDQSYYMNKIVIASPKRNENFVIHEQIHDEETYRSHKKRSKLHYTEQIEEDIDEMMYTKPIQGENKSKKWLSEEKNVQKSKDNISQLKDCQEDYKTEFENSDEQKSSQGFAKSNYKNSQLKSQTGYETDEFHNNQQNEQTSSQKQQIMRKSNEKMFSEDNQQNEYKKSLRNSEVIHQSQSEKKNFSDKYQNPEGDEQQITSNNQQTNMEQQENPYSNNKNQNSGLI